MLLGHGLPRRQTFHFLFEITVFSNDVLSQTNWNGYILKYSALKLEL